MTTRQVHIDRLKLRVPRAAAARTQGSVSGGEVLARSTAASLMAALAEGRGAAGGASLRAVRVTVPRRKAGAEEMARAICAALERALPPQGRES